MMLFLNFVMCKLVCVRFQLEKGIGIGSMKKNYFVKLRSIGKDIYKFLYEVENEVLKD